MDKRILNLFTDEDAARVLYQLKLQRKAEVIDARAGLFLGIADMLMVIGHLLKTHANELSVGLNTETQVNKPSYEKILGQIVSLNSELEYLKNYLEWISNFFTKSKMNISVLKHEKSTLPEPAAKEKYSQDKLEFMKDQIIVLGDNCQMIAGTLLIIVNTIKPNLNRHVINGKIGTEAMKKITCVDKEKEPKAFQIQFENSKG